VQALHVLLQQGVAAEFTPARPAGEATHRVHLLLVAEQ